MFFGNWNSLIVLYLQLLILHRFMSMSSLYNLGHIDSFSDEKNLEWDIQVYTFQFIITRLESKNII